MSSLCEWDGISVKDHPRYLKIRRVLEKELDDNLVTMGNSEVRSDYWDFFELSFPRSPEVSENLKTQLSLALNTLSSRERCVLSMRFGLGELVSSYWEFKDSDEITNEEEESEFEALEDCLEGMGFVSHLM